MFRFSGRLSRREYARQLMFLYAAYILIAAVLVGLSRFLDANGFNITLVLAILVAISATWLMAISGIVLRRARDTGSTFHWASTAMLLPFMGLIILGCIPSAKNTK